MPKTMDASLAFVPSHVISGVDRRTTLMIKSLPNRLSEQQLAELIRVTHTGEFDFLYLPVDVRNGRNAGYAFVNFTSCDSALTFWECWHGRPCPVNGTQACAITYARKQVLAASIDAPRSEGACRTGRRRRKHGGS